MGWEPGADKERRAQELLDKNAAIIFKLSGLAQLRRRSGANLPPSAEEEALLAEAQHCLQSVALLLPPNALMQPTTAKRLRQHLAEPPEPQAAPLPAAEEEGGGGKRRQLEPPLMQPAQPQQQTEHTQLLQRQQQLAQLQLQHHHPGQAPQLQQAHSLDGAPAGSGGSAGARPGPAGTFAGMGSLQPPASSLLGGLQSAPSASQGSLLGLRLDSGRLPAADAAAATAAVSTFGGASRSSGSMQLGQLGPSSGPQQQAQDALRQHASLPLAAALQAPTAKEDLWLLSQAYGSMTAEQKESLAAQPPEVRQYVIRERMRKTREQLDFLQRQRAAAQAAGLAAQPTRGPGLEPWSGMGSPGLGGGSMPLQQPQADWPAAATPQYAQQARLQQQPSLGSMPPPQPELAGSQDAMRGPSFGSGLPHMNGPPAFPGMKPPQQAASLFPQQLDLVPSQPGPGAPAAAGGGAGGAAPFVSMSEADRLEHLRMLKRRQDEWLEQQRRAAAMLSEGGAVG